MGRRRYNRQKRCAIAGILAAATSVCFAAQPGPKVSATPVRYWTLNDATRIVVETTGEFEFKSDRAYEPDRVFFDVKGAKVRLDSKLMKTVPVGDHLIKQVRIAETQPGVTRIVFDLESAVDFSASHLTNPDRLIVEFRPAAALPAVPAQIAKAVLAPSVVTSVVEKSPPATAVTAAAVESVSKTGLAAAPVRKEKPASLKAPRAATLPDSGQSMARVLGLKIGRIVLDAGHGGHDTGTIGPRGLREKDLVLDVTKRLGALIESRMGAEVVYTRSDDNYVGLENRTQMANEHRADLFLSIHANSSPSSDASGVETYYLHFTTSKSAMEVAARENASSQKTVYELGDLVQKIAKQDKVEESREFAARIQQSLYAASSRTINRTRNRGVKNAPFVVLIGASMPSVLVEIGFVSNPKDEALLKKAATRQKIAEGLYKGLAQYAATMSQFQVASN